MSANDDIARREVFHLLFLRRLLQLAGPGLFVLKGGVNLRFFLRSPRYSEDMDLDAIAGAPATLTKNGYKVLQDAALRRELAVHGIVDVRINDPASAKQTATTQRFRVRLVTQDGAELPTKIEFSRRAVAHRAVEENVDPAIAQAYRILAFRCRHYAGREAAEQKVQALAGRAASQARDAFDLYILLLGGHVPQPTAWGLAAAVRQRAHAALAAMSFDQFTGQVGAYLGAEARATYAGQDAWREMQRTLLARLAPP